MWIKHFWDPLFYLLIIFKFTKAILLLPLRAFNSKKKSVTEWLGGQKFVKTVLRNFWMGPKQITFQESGY